MSETPPAGDAGQSEPAQYDKRNIAEIAADSLGHDLLDLLVHEVEQTVTWKGMTEMQIQTVIDRLRARVQKLVTEALAILLKGEYPNCKAVLESVAIKDGIKAVLKIGRTEHHLIELAEHVGTPVVLVMADPGKYLEHIEKVRAARDQRDLFDASGNLKVTEEKRPDDAAAGEQADGQGLAPVADAQPQLWEQSQKLLARIGIPMEADTLQDWTEAQHTEAAYWVQLVEDKGGRAGKAPKHVTPPEGWVAKGWKK
jgi:GTP:adenosylcobinamide-phosphate guanylyltransferase